MSVIWKNKVAGLSVGTDRSRYVGVSNLDDCASRAKEGLRLVAIGEDKIIEGWLICGAALNEGREMFPSDEQFGRWVKGNLPETEQKEREAAMWAAANPEDFKAMRKANPMVRTVRGLHAKWKIKVNKPVPKPPMDNDDKRKVRKLQAIIDDHAADPNTVEACKRKLDGYKTAHGEKAVEDYLESVSVIDEDEDLDIFGLKREAAATERLDQIMEWLREGLHKKEVEDILYCVFIDAYNPLDDDEGLEKLSVVYKEIKTEMEN